MKAYINGTEVSFEQGDTILKAAKRAGVFIPTLCAFEPLKHTPGSCRVCLVETTLPGGEPRIVTSCNTPMQEGMQVNTRTQKVRAMQRLQVEMIFADHEQNCSACARHGDCELQALAQYVGLEHNRFSGMQAERPVDRSATALVRDVNKCVRCMRCVEVCRQVQGIGALTMDGVGLEAGVGVGISPDWASSSCVQCGQCTLVCPTGALAEKDDTDKVLDYLDNPAITTVFQFAPAVRVTLSDEFGIPRSTDVDVTGQIVAALRRLGADVVLDTNFGADVVIMEEGTELLHKIQEKAPLPMFTSCCPGWINYAEKHFPEILPYLSSTRSPQQVFGPLAKTYLPQKMGLAPNAIRVISIMPCVAKKGEGAREALSSNGVPDVDVVLTVREFARLLRRQGIDLASLEPSAFDNPFMSDYTGAAAIFGSTGGVMEAAIRTVYAVLNGHELETIEIAPLRGMDGIREATVNLGEGNGEVRVAICHGLKNARVLVEQVLAGKSPYHFIEVMACPGGCVDGGGTCRIKNDYLPQAHVRQQALYSIDKKLPRRQSHNNPQVQKLYADFLEKPNSPKAHDLLHTHYTNRKSSTFRSVQELWDKLTLAD